jgi:peptidoglycan/LPS O-acetylase OafA/YrhL
MPHGSTLPSARLTDPPSPPASAYIPALDGLRAVAILLVVAAHAGLERLVPGAFGVTLFFFISGYLITRQLLASLARTGHIGLANFYFRRVLRLAPAGLVYIALSGLAYTAAGGHISAPGWLAAIFYGANFYDLWTGYRSTLAGVRHPFNILWSLAVEEHFYALWPIVLGLIWRWRAAALLVLALCVAVLAWRIALFDHCTWHFSTLCGRVQPNPAWRYNRLYQGTDTRIDSIAWGALLALLERSRPAWTIFATRALWPAGLVLLAVGFLAATGDFGHQALRTTLQGAALLLLFPALLGRESLARRLLCLGPALWIGRLSYSLYLWHWGAFAVADRLAPAGTWQWLVVGLPLAGLLSVASYRLVEQPMLSLRRRAGSEASRSFLKKRTNTPFT